MPQMAPISWTLLFILFTLVFLLFILLNFFLINYINKEKKITSKKDIKLNWKW